MLRALLLAGLILLVAGCGSNNSSDSTTVKVREVEQVGSYTYLLVKAKGPEYWIAVSSMEAQPGETYSYQGGLLMEDFYSKELDRTFEKVLFVDALYEGTSIQAQQPQSAQALPEVDYENMVTIERSDVAVESGEGTVTIADIYADPSAYEGEVIRVKGEVTKFNAAILNRNWIHIQDGTVHEGKFDLTATSIEAFKVGDIITVEGILALHKDFGYGYSYELLLEKATAIQ